MQSVCFCCNEGFESPLHVPHFLPDCGHSLCFSCLQRLLSQTVPSCPQCSTTFSCKSIERFPTNLQLVSPKQHRSVKSSELQAKCPKHGRPLEAFCLLESMPICVGCLMANEHKFHEVIPLKSACESQKLRILEMLQTLPELHESLIKELKTILEPQRTGLKNEFEGTIEEIRGIFGRLHSVLNEKQVEIEEKVRKELSKREKELDMKEMSLSRSLEFLMEFQRDYEEVKRNRDLDILSWGLKQEKRFEELLSDKDKKDRQKVHNFKGVFKKSCRFEAFFKEITEIMREEEAKITGNRGFLEKVKVKGKENWGGYLKMREKSTINSSKTEESSFLIEEQRKFQLKMANLMLN